MPPKRRFPDGHPLPVGRTSLADATLATSGMTTTRFSRREHRSTTPNTKYLMVVSRDLRPIQC
jgi:hypothetical protein